MKFLERPWYFKGEALAKHLMGKCAKSQAIDGQLRQSRNGLY